MGRTRRPKALALPSPGVTFHLPRPKELIMTKRFVPALALSAVLLATAALAAPPPRTRGTIQSMNGDELTLDTRSGQKIEVKMTPDTKVLSATQAQFSDIKPDSFVGVTAAPEPGGSKLKALEVHVFAPSLRGTGEGHYDWDLGPSTSMTNGAVGALAGTQGRTMTVNYKGGDKQIDVPDDTPIVAMEPADKSVIKNGAHVLVLGNKGADGTVSAAALVVGVNGVTPPM